MSIRIDGDTVYLEGDCGVEDAEALASALENGPARRVNLSPCRHLHSAVVQALLAFRPTLEGASEEDFLNRLVLPALAEAGAGDNSMEGPE